MLSSANSGAARPPAKAAPVHEVCPICGGTGFVVPDLPIADPDFGKALPCRCRQQARLARKLYNFQRMGGLETLHRLTFESFIAEPGHYAVEHQRNLARAAETCIHYAQEPDGWLLLVGAFGCGKTHLAAAIANARLDLGEPVLFMVVPDLLDHLRTTFGPDSDITYDNLFEELRNTPLLVLDDLGAHSATPWAQEKLFQLLNHRYNAQLSTVITTNQRLDEIEPRLRSRLLDQRLVSHCIITAPDFRAGSNPMQSDLSSLGLHQDQTFESFDIRRNDLDAEERINLKEVFELCRSFAQQPEGWLVIMGHNGAGKTHLAAAMANYLASVGRYEVMFIVTPDLLDHLRASFSPQSTVSYDRRFDQIKKAPILVLDNLETASATPWAKEKLFQLLNYRYTARLPTIITTTDDPQNMEPWLLSRVVDVRRCRFTRLDVPSYISTRTQAKQKNIPLRRK